MTDPDRTWLWQTVMRLPEGVTATLVKAPMPGVRLEFRTKAEAVLLADELRRWVTELETGIPSLPEDKGQ